MLGESLHIERVMVWAGNKVNSKVSGKLSWGQTINPKKKLYESPPKRIFLVSHSGKQIDEFVLLEMMLGKRLHIERVMVWAKNNVNSKVTRKLSWGQTINPMKKLYESHKKENYSSL